MYFIIMKYIKWVIKSDNRLNDQHGNSIKSVDKTEFQSSWENIVHIKWYWKLQMVTWKYAILQTKLINLNEWCL